MAGDCRAGRMVDTFEDLGFVLEVVERGRAGVSARHPEPGGCHGMGGQTSRMLLRRGQPRFSLSIWQRAWGTH